MFKKTLLVIVAIFFLSKLSFAGLTTYELVGVVKSDNHNAVVKSVKAALSKDFRVITLFNPAGDKNLTVLILQDETFFNAVDNTGRNSFFALPLRVGVQQAKGVNNVMFTNPVYVAAAYAKGEDKLLKTAKTVKNKLEKSLLSVANISAAKKDFGYSTDLDEIGSWQMMGQSIYTISKIGSKKFQTIDAAVSAISDSLKKHTNGWTQVYAIKLKNAEIIGVSNPKFEKEAFEIGGNNHLCAFPIEIVIKGEKGDVAAWILPEMYRMSLYFMDAGMGAFSAHMSMPGEIDASLSGLLK